MITVWERTSHNPRRVGRKNQQLFILVRITHVGLKYSYVHWCLRNNSFEFYLTLPNLEALMKTSSICSIKFETLTSLPKIKYQKVLKWKQRSSTMNNEEGTKKHRKESRENIFLNDNNKKEKGKERIRGKRESRGQQVEQNRVGQH